MYPPPGQIYTPQQAQQMFQAYGNQMGSLNALGMGALNPSTFFYMGNVIGLESKLQDVCNQSVPITDATITVTGNQIKQPNIGCLLLTTILGGILIFPLFFMCCGWWKKIVNAGFTVPLSTYQKLQALIFSPSIRSISITVCDSTFDKTKTECLYSMLSRSTLRGFNFTNIASPNDFNSNQWSDFKPHMKPIKSLSMLTQIKWYDQVVL